MRPLSSRPRLLILLGAVMLPGPRILPAQAATRDASLLRPAAGQLVRVTLPPDLRGRQRTRDAVVLASSPDSMRLAWRGGDTASLALLEMRRLELGLGPHRPVAASAAWGALIGGVGLGVFVRITTDDGFFSSREIAAVAALAGALGGAAIGAVVGNLRTSERWRTVYRSGDRVAVMPVLGRERGVRLRITF
jgi:hypothetical protein